MPLINSSLIANTHEKRIYAHRGASRDFPENSLEAFDEGLRQGANALEFDLQQSKDGVIVVFHDDDAQRLLGIDKKIAELSWQELRLLDLNPNKNIQKFIRIPRLEEVLERYTQTVFNIDIKFNSDFGIIKVIELLEKCHATPRVTLAAFQHQTLAKIRKLGYSGATGFSRWEVALLFFSPDFIRECLSWPGFAVQVPISFGRFRFDTRHFINLCHNLGKRVDYWTINNKEEAQRLFNLGADGIITDVPALISSRL